MKIVHLNSSNLKDWKQHAKPNVMALGFFDGVHNGHKKVIQTAGEIARKKKLPLSVMSFFPHPKVLLAKEPIEFDYIMPLSKKAAILESLNVDTFYIVKFDKEFLSLLPKQFVSDYLIDLQVQHAVAGFDFTYGQRGAGHVDRLKQDADDRIEVTKVGLIDYQGQKMSSTWIRELISTGQMAKLFHILGRFYETEVYWDGEMFRPSEYYMLPAPGAYQVAISLKGEIQHTEAYISNYRNGIYLQDFKLYKDVSRHETMEITWYDRKKRGNGSYVTFAV